MSAYRLRWRGRSLAGELPPGAIADPRVEAIRDGNLVWVSFEGRTACFEIDRRAALAGAATSVDPEVRAPMTGRVLSVRVKPGDAVKSGDILAVLEAMKMEYRLAAPSAGKVASVNCKDGEQVDLGRVLVVLDPAP